MFYGLNKLIKNLLPKQLFYRALLIVAAPIIILQITISIVFFDSLWIKTNKGMTKSLVSEIYTFIEAYKNEADYNKQKLTDLYYQNFQLNIKYIENESMPILKNERWFSPIDRTLRRELKSKFNNYWFDTLSYKEMIILKIKYRNGILQFTFPKERVTNTSARIFALWITLPAFLLIFIASVSAKDVLVAVDAKEFKGKLLEQDKEYVFFKPDGAQQSQKIPIRLIKEIRLGNGEIIDFGNDYLTAQAKNDVNLKKEIIFRGVSPDRLIFAKRLPRLEYLARYRVADLFLDTLPYNAGTSASDALRMGLPVLTCIGNSFASRMAASVINAVNLPELITTSQEQYESLAIELATNPEKLKIIKDKLVNNLPTAPLYDTPLFTRHLESAYLTMYDRYQQGLDPDHIYVEH